MATAPDSAHLHSNLGYVLLQQGRHDEALAAIRQALTLDPGFERAWDNLARLAAARSDALLAEQARLRRLDGMAAAPAPGTPAATARGPQRWAAGKIRNAGGFELIAVSRELQADGAYIRLASAPVAPIASTALAAPRPATDGKALPFRLELANGNGVTGFATRFGRQLRSDGIAVSRITNQKPYTVATTTIEYQPGHEGAARSLAARTGIPGRLVEARQARQGTDIRLVLGRDLIDRAAGRGPAAARI